MRDSIPIFRCRTKEGELIFENRARFEMYLAVLGNAELDLALSWLQGSDIL